MFWRLERLRMDMFWRLREPPVRGAGDDPVEDAAELIELFNLAAFVAAVFAAEAAAVAFVAASFAALAA